MNGKALTSQCKVVCRREFFFGLWPIKHWKIPIAYRQWGWNFPTMERKAESYVFSGFGNGGLERKCTSGRFATSQFFSCVRERFLLSVRNKLKTENFVHWKLRPLFVSVVFQRNFSSWALALTHFTIFIRGLLILLFPFINKADFSCQVKGYCV